MKFSILILVLFLSTAQAADHEHCDQMVPWGYPITSIQDNTILCRIAYVVDHDNKRKTPIYSAEWLLSENLDGKVIRVNAFKPDPDLLPGQRATLADYNKSYDIDNKTPGSNRNQDFDRGHMTPFDDTRVNSAAALQTFYLSNMVPQNLYLNRGIWHKLENRTRALAKASKNGLFVITGPVYIIPYNSIGNGVAVPQFTYKVIIDKENKQGIAYMMPNSKPQKGDTLVKFQHPISDIEKITGINFTPLLQDSTFKTTIGQEFK